MIEVIWRFFSELWDFFSSNFDPWRDTIDILLVTAGIYWLLLLIRGTRAIQILVGLIVLIGLSLASELFQFATVGLILENFLSSAVLIIIVLFQNDIRRALARVGRGFFPSVTAQQESQMLEEVVRAAQTLSQRRIGALVVLERETALTDQIEAGRSIDAEASKELLVSLFMPVSPLHDGAVVVADGRVASAGCILPLTVSTELPEGVGTRHRAAVGITEETDAVVVVVSEETGGISVVMGGEMMPGLDAPTLRVVLRDIMAGERRDLSPAGVAETPFELADVGPGSADASRTAT
ncbi:MAG: TIGR00159 family protein [Deltaproteobacteria bacterium]|nr:TIGR00159 family protein [Deltaproteobacteria bacterium]MBW2383211.1 TIGR00159 family protein [Deltaproteobacteria bacterium]MBW2696114.1 TIGR00159 family protein [Deltaproteobacteria bacterium]